MSSQGNLATGSYTQDAVEMARSHRDFVIGFIAMNRDNIQKPEAAPDTNEDFLILTPGVGLDSRGDSMGQQYKTPREVILERRCDIIIVGRGIYSSGDSVGVKAAQQQAKRYQEAGWSAYLERLGALPSL
jgi:orotidine-5'-phosphate decarboxylase